MEGMVASTRSQLKAQSAAFEMKLEHTRAAGSSALKNQAAEAQHVFEKQLEAKVAEVKADDTQLDEARAQLMDAHKQIDSAKMKLEGLQDALKQAQRHVDEGLRREEELAQQKATLESEKEVLQKDFCKEEC